MWEKVYSRVARDDAVIVFVFFFTLIGTSARDYMCECDTRAVVLRQGKLLTRAKNRNSTKNVTTHKANSDFLLFPRNGNELWRRDKKLVHTTESHRINSNCAKLLRSDRKTIFIYNVVRKKNAANLFSLLLLCVLGAYTNIFYFGYTLCVCVGLWMKHTSTQRERSAKTHTPFKSTNHSASLSATLTLLFDDDNRRYRLKATTKTTTYILMSFLIRYTRCCSQILIEFQFSQGLLLFINQWRDERMA